MPEQWLEAEENLTVTVKADSPEFCLYCDFIVRVSNDFEASDADAGSAADSDGDVSLKLVVQQTESRPNAGDPTRVDKVFKTEVIPGSPQPVRLDRGQISYMYFKGDISIDEVQVEVLLGDAEMTLTRSSDDTLLSRYPDSSQPAETNLVTFAFSQQERADADYAQLALHKTIYYALELEAKSEVFEAAVYVKPRDALDLLTDGAPHEASFAYSGALQGPGATAQYFVYFPTSHESELLINAQLKRFESDLLSVYDLSEGTRITDGSDRPLFDPKFFNFKIGLKTIKLKNDVKGKYTKWAEEFSHDEQFDHVFHTKETRTGLQLFELVNLQADPETDIVLVRVDGAFDPKHAGEFQHMEVTVAFQMSASDVSYLAPEQAVRSVVTDDPSKYKIFEVYVNSMQFPADAAVVDMFIKLTPCTGHLQFYISDDFGNLFQTRSRLDSGRPGQSIDARVYRDGIYDPHVGVHVVHKESKVGKGSGVTLAMNRHTNEFGIQGKRLKDIGQLNGKKLYIGVSSKNMTELHGPLFDADQRGSYEGSSFSGQFAPIFDKFGQKNDHLASFEISFEYLAAGAPDILDQYQLQNASYGIRIEDKGGHGTTRQMRISWSPLTNLTSSGRYAEMKNSVKYDLYLGFNNESLRVFSSQC